MTVKDLYNLFSNVVNQLRQTNNITSFTKKDSQYYTVVVSANTGLENYDSISISGTVNFDGTYKLLNLSGTSFDIAKTGTYLTESGLCSQLKPYFTIGNWKEVAADLLLKGSSKILDNQRYPFILLHSEMTFREKSLRYSGMVNPKIYILTQSDPNLSTLDRLNGVYTNVLYPLCDRFLYAMKNSRYFETVKNEFQDFNYNKSELFYYNSLKANQNKLNDFVDGIELDFSELKVFNQYEYQAMPIINFNQM